VVASPDYLAQRGQPTAPEDIAKHDTIQFGSIASAPEWRQCHETFLGDQSGRGAGLSGCDDMVSCCDRLFQRRGLFQ